MMLEYEATIEGLSVTARNLTAERDAARARVQALEQAFDLIEEMAEKYAEGGGRHGPELRTFHEARELRGK